MKHLRKSLVIIALLIIAFVVIPLTFKKQAVTAQSDTTNYISYKGYVQRVGWQNSVQDGSVAGTTGESKRLEAVQISLNDLDGIVNYRTYVDGSGWQSWKTDGQISGTTGDSRAITSIQITLSGNASNVYDIYYQLHKASVGWTGWHKNGAACGTSKLDKRAEALIVLVVPKGTVPNKISSYAINPVAMYEAHTQSVGWQGETYYYGVAGTVGLDKRIEAIRMHINSETYTNFGIEYSTNVASIGWQNYSTDGNLSGTTGKSLPIYGLRVRLTGYNSAMYKVYYRTYTTSNRWSAWVSSGAISGNTNSGNKIEAIQVVIKKYTEKAPENDVPVTSTSTIKFIGKGFVQSYRWLDDVGNLGIIGTKNQGKRLESVKLSLTGVSSSELGIKYTSYVQRQGWQDWKSNGQISGTSNKSLRIEAMRIQLTGTLADNFDVYYRAYVQNYGWLGWAVDGQIAGTMGLAKRMEAIQVMIVPAGAKAPGSTSNTSISYSKHGIDVSKWQGAINWTSVRNSGIQFAMVRVSYGTTLDGMYAKNIDGASGVGLPVGVYCYSTATTPEGAAAEAQAVINAIKGHNVTYPIAYDLEDEAIQGGLSKERRHAMILAFKKVVENNGYSFILYVNKNWADNYIDVSSLSGVDLWLARYRSESLGFDNDSDTGSSKITFSPNLVKMWQYSSTGSVSGIVGNVDMNIAYKTW